MALSGDESKLDLLPVRPLICFSLCPFISRNERALAAKLSQRRRGYSNCSDPWHASVWTVFQFGRPIQGCITFFTHSFI